MRRGKAGRMADRRPIGIFDSGIGGLTVARAIASELPGESMVYLGDTLRCPYGPRPQDEVRGFVRQIVAWFAERDVKLLVIACNTATAAGLDLAQRSLPIPVLGVIVPGARAVVQETHSRRVGVLATQGTCSSGSYPAAIRALDAGVQVWQAPSARGVEVVERHLSSPAAMGKDWMSDREAFDTPEVRAIAEEDTAPLRGHGIDAVILGCTHFPLLAREYRRALGPEVRVVSSAEETAREVRAYLERAGALARPLPVEGEEVESAQDPTAHPTYHFATTSPELGAFAVAGEYVFGRRLKAVERVDVATLEALGEAFKAQEAREAESEAGANTSKRVVVATGNPHKLREIGEILAPALPGVEFVSVRELGDFPEPEEDGETFIENALIKARAAAEETGLPAVADDSGLDVDALGGEPGVRSARWAGVHGDDLANNEKLMARMAEVPEEARTARFRSAVCLVTPEGEEVVAEGACEGMVGYEPRGTGGFGYDPLFWPADTPGQTMAELTPEQKNAISHRFHALSALAEKLRSRTLGSSTT